MTSANSKRAKCSPFFSLKYNVNCSFYNYNTSISLLEPPEMLMHEHMHAHEICMTFLLRVASGIRIRTTCSQLAQLELAIEISAAV